MSHPPLQERLPIGAAIVANREQFGALRAAMPECELLAAYNTAALPPTPVVIWLDGLDAGEVTVLGTALEGRARIDVAVLGERADGFTAPPLAGLCRGLIAGFGHAGLRAAVRFLDGR